MKMGKTAYIVICYTIGNGDGAYHIDSVWTSDRKAENRKNELNSDSRKDWREDYGYGLFDVEVKFFSK